MLHRPEFACALVAWALTIIALAPAPAVSAEASSVPSGGPVPDEQRWHRASSLLTAAEPGAAVFGFAPRPASLSPRLAPELDEVLRQAGPEETVPVLIYLGQHGLPTETRDRIRSLPRSVRKAEGARELRRRAEVSQSALVAHLRRLERVGEASSLRSLFLVNAVAVHVPAERIYDLLRFPEVRRIDWDPIHDAEEAEVFDREEGMGSGQTGGTPVVGNGPALLAGSGTSAGGAPVGGGQTRGDGLDPTVFTELYRIRAPECWSAGYDGTGVLVAVLDEGFQYTHPDVATRLYINPGEIADNDIDDDENGFVDDVNGWDFINGDNDPLLTSGNDHGTNVLGLVAGDGTNGFLTGVAKGATFLPIASVSAAFSSSVWFAGFDYAALMGADVVVMSATQKWTASSLKPNFDAWREVMENELTLGIVHANSAGNRGLLSYESPVPFNIGAPATCPSPWSSPFDFHAGGRTSVVSVGALTTTNLIRDSSSRGPCNWEDLGINWPSYTDSMRIAYQDYPWSDGSGGLLKPDLCAPGEELKTLGFGGGYVDRSGTSFATPYVGGTMAILLQARPDLTPEQIDEALQWTAQDLGDTGKDVVYGAGLLDCYDALQYVLDLDDQSYLDGYVRNASSLDSLAGAEVRFLAPPRTYRANEHGRIRVPIKAGIHAVVFSHYGFRPDTLVFNVAVGDVHDFTADLDTLSTGSIVGIVRGADEAPIAGATVQIAGTPRTATTDEGGSYRFDEVPGGDLLEVEAFKFNYAVATDTLTLEPGVVDTVDLTLALGLFDDFERDQGWWVGDSGDAALSGVWERSDPNGTFVGLTPVQPEEDFSLGGSLCFHTQNSHPGAGPLVSEVARGRTSLFSPLFDGTVYEDPVLSYARWLSNDTDGNTANDANSLRVLVSSDGGENWTEVEAPGTSAGGWNEVSIPLSSFVTLSDSMQIRINATDITTAGVVEAAIDDVRIAEDDSDISSAEPGPGSGLVLALEPGQPNPFRESTTLRFQIPESGDVDLDVYDVQGRRVRELVATRLEPGFHTVAWDGRDDRGNALASGLYFYRLVQGESIVTGRALRMR